MADDINLPAIAGIVATEEESGRHYQLIRGLWRAKAVAETDLGAEHDLTSNYTRRLNVDAGDWWDWIPAGRTVVEDRCQNTISWMQSVGTVAYSTVRPYPGSPNCIRLTTGAGAGNQAQALLRHFRIADGIARADGPKSWFGVLFKVTDANLGFVELGVQLADDVNLMVARLRYTPGTGKLSVLNSGGTYTDLPGVFMIPTSEGWHWLGMELFFQSGLATLKYVRARLDDITVDPASYIPAQTFGAAATSYSLFEMTVQNNGAVATTVDIGYAVVKDLVFVRGLLG